MKVLAFDIGIKNLAWACIEKQDTKISIKSWDNYNLLSSESNVDAKSSATKCAYCSSKATYQTNTPTTTTTTCVRHCPPLYPALRDPSGNLLKKMPSVNGLKEILSGRTAVGQRIPTKKPELEKEVAKYFSLPILTKKVSKAPDVGLSEIHDSIKKLVLKERELWSTCNTILLENQPVFKNPTMKSVQILLFATLRDLLKEPLPILKLVHAGKKVKGVISGDEGYKDRKAGSEMRVEKLLNDPTTLLDASKCQQIWSKATKKSDLADALCMCLDAVA